MKKDVIKVFMPGRLSLIGEHSDWASNYKSENSDIVIGSAIVVKINDGIFAKCSKDKRIIINYLNEKKISIDYSEIDEYIEKDSFWKYILSGIRFIKNKFDIDGINININKVTLPMKKGLGSSAAVILLSIHSLNLLYDLNLSEEEEMEYAYLSELSIGSKCGRLDQIGVSKSDVLLLTFDKKTKFDNIIIGKDIHLVFADLNKEKDTVKILSDLNNCYPYYKNEKEKKVHLFLGEKNREYVGLAKKYIEDGDVYSLGKLYTKYQNDVDKYLVPITKALDAPYLNEVLNDSFIKNITLGGKGCGSFGDGSVQFIVEDEEKQKELIDYMKEKYNMIARSITIKSNKIKKALIPIGGFGTRMYPMTKFIGKEFLPIIDKNKRIKPAILVLLEELIDAGIEEIGLIIPKKYLDNYKKLFTYNEKYSEFDEKYLEEIYSKITFIYDDKQIGVKNAIKLGKKFIKDDNFMLLLGDQIYKSYTKDSCLKQVLSYYYKVNKPVIAAYDTPLEDVSKYGILTGDKVVNNSFKINRFTEKPNKSVLEKEKLYTISNNSKKYYSVFGCYILTNSFLKLTEKEFEFPEMIKNYTLENETFCFIPNGRYFDVGNVDNYIETLMEFNK